MSVSYLKNSVKKIFACAMCAALIATVFAGCSSSDENAKTITDETMLVAYTAENEPFIYEDENGELVGFDVEIVKKVFDDVKNEYENYKFIKVDEDYTVGEDAAYTDKDGNEYIAYIMIGGVQKNVGTVNENNSFTADLINNHIVVMTAENSDIKSYSDLKDKKVGIASQTAKEAFESHTAIKDGCTPTVYTSVESAFEALDSGKEDAVAVDYFSLNDAGINAENYDYLAGELGNIEYAFMFNKGNSLAESFNEAIYELKSPDYNDEDEFTPIVEKYFGYNASNFDYTPSETD